MFYNIIINGSYDNFGEQFCLIAKINRDAQELRSSTSPLRPELMKNVRLELDFFVSFIFEVSSLK